MKSWNLVDGSRSYYITIKRFFEIKNVQVEAHVPVKLSIMRKGRQPEYSPREMTDPIVTPEMIEEWDRQLDEMEAKLGLQFYHVDQTLDGRPSAGTRVFAESENDAIQRVKDQNQRNFIITGNVFRIKHGDLGKQTRLKELQKGS